MTKSVKLTPKQTEIKKQENEFKVLNSVFKFFMDLDHNQRQRIYNWVGQRFGLVNPPQVYPSYPYYPLTYTGTNIQSPAQMPSNPSFGEYQIFCSTQENLPLLDPKDYHFVEQPLTKA